MKRSLLATLIVGIFVFVAVNALQLSAPLLRLEIKAMEFISSYRSATQIVASKWQYLFVAIASFGVAWLTVTSARRGRMGLIVVGLLIELVALAWICALYRVFFQPLPAMVAVVLAYAIGSAYATIALRGRTVTARSMFGERLSKEQLHRIISGDIPFEPEARPYEGTVVVCDVANKYDLADDCDPATFGQITEAFIRRASEVFLQAGAYIQAADGEGVVALFGFPEGDIHHGDKAVRVALDLVERFRESRSNNSEASAKCDVHLGVSSGIMIVAPMQDGDRPSLLTSGEAIELARRFCVANRFYGSRILIGPRAFELASRYVVARPIDFLSGVNSRERHEIYEPLWPAAEAKPEQLARRDSFWNGVVFYREKRWAEAYSEFLKARGPNDEEDAPLQLYLRRLEPLALHLTDALSPQQS